MENNEIQRQRENFIQQIRKSNRDDIFSKRRNLNSKNLSDGSMEQERNEKKPLIIDQQRRGLILSFIEEKYSIDQLPQLVNYIHSTNIELRHKGIIGIRKVISIDQNPPIQQVIDAQLIPTLIQIIKQPIYPQLRLQATWILTNVCSGTTNQCESIIQKGGIPIFVQLLIENDPGIVDQAVWAIGNLSGDCVEYRDLILKTGAIEHLNKIVNSSKDKNMIRQIAWTLSNLCRGTPLPKYDQIKNGIVSLCKIVKTDILDKQNLIDSLWAISYACESQKSRIQRVVETGVINQLIKIMDTDHLNVLTPTLRILGNISVGNQLQTQQLLKNGILEEFNKLIDHDKKSIRRQVCWIISNITAGTKPQVELFLKNITLAEKVIQLFENDVNQVKRQICYIFANMTNLGDKNVIFDLFINRNIVDYYAKLLIEVTQIKTLEVVLQTLSTVLSIGVKMKQQQGDPNVLVHKLIAIPGVIQSIQKLQYHESRNIYNKTVKLLQTYFDLEQNLNF